MPSVIFKTKVVHCNKHCDLYCFLSFTPGMKYTQILILIYKSQGFVIL